MGGLSFGGGYFGEYSLAIPSQGTHTSIHVVNEVSDGPGLTNVQSEAPTVVNCAVGEPTITGVTGI